MHSWCNEMNYGFKKNSNILEMSLYCGGPCIVLVLDVSVLDLLGATFCSVLVLDVLDELYLTIHLLKPNLDNH